MLIPIIGHEFELTDVIDIDMQCTMLIPIINQEFEVTDVIDIDEVDIAETRSYSEETTLFF